MSETRTQTLQMNGFIMMCTYTDLELNILHLTQCFQDSVSKIHFLVYHPMGFDHDFVEIGRQKHNAE